MRESVLSWSFYLNDVTHIRCLTVVVAIVKELVVVRLILAKMLQPFTLVFDLGGVLGEHDVVSGGFFDQEDIRFVHFIVRGPESIL